MASGKKRLTQDQEFQIMKLVLDKFLWLGFVLMAFGMYFLGFVMAPVNVVILATLWESTAIVSALIVSGRDRTVTWEKFLWFSIMAVAIACLSWAGHKLYQLFDVQ